jgi:hypothetical protein
MKKTLLTLVAAIAMTFVYANTTPTQDLFADDLTSMEQQFTDLSAVEQVANEQGITYAELVAANNALASSLKAENDLSASLLGANAPDERVLGIPGFWWGFCTGLIGVVLMYVAIEDPAAKKREGKQALIGCIVFTVLWTVLYFALIAGSLASGG